MYIPSNVEELLLTPMLNGELNKPIFNIRLAHDKEEIELHAFLSRESNEGPFQLTIHAPKDKDFSHLFSKNSPIAHENTTSAKGVLDGKLKIEIPRIFRPDSNNCQDEHRSASITISELNIPIDGWDGMTKQEKIVASGGEPIDEAKTETTEQNFSEFDHLALLPNVKIQFSNDSIQTEQKHSFWRHEKKEVGKLQNGEIFAGEYSIRSYGKHLLIGLKHQEESEKEAEKKFTSLVRAVAFSHACQPWPAYEIVRKDDRIIKHQLHTRAKNQGDFTPLSVAINDNDKEAAHRLISSTAEFFYLAPLAEAKQLANSLWIFRSADNITTPFPLRQSIVCGVVESLFNFYKPKHTDIIEPEEFKNIKNDLPRLVKELKNLHSNDDAYKPHLEKLKQYLEGFKYKYKTTRELWNETFPPLFPEEQQYVSQQLKNFKLRNTVAHGNYSIREEKLSTQRHELGELAAFVNAIIAAKAGYTGKLKSNIWGNETIKLKCQKS